MDPQYLALIQALMNGSANAGGTASTSGIDWEAIATAKPGSDAAALTEKALADYRAGADAAVTGAADQSQSMIERATTTANGIGAPAGDNSTLSTPPVDNIALYLANIQSGGGPNYNPNVGTDIEGAVNGMYGANPTNRANDTTYSGSTAPYYDGAGNLTAAGNGQQYMQWIGSLMGGAKADPVAEAKAATDKIFGQGQAATGQGGTQAAKPPAGGTIDPAMQAIMAQMTGMQTKYQELINQQNQQYQSQMEALRKDALNKGQNPRLAKTVVTDKAKMNTGAGSLGITSTNLTGVTGVDPSKLTLGKNNVLGA